MKYIKRVEGKYSELEMVVFYDYTPPQKETLTDPSWPEEVEINAVCIDGVELDDWLTKEKMDLLKEEILEQVSNDAMRKMTKKEFDAHMMINELRSYRALEN